MTFAIQVHDWLIRLVWVGINQSRTRIVKNIINSENCYVIYLLRIIDIQNILKMCCIHIFDLSRVYEYHYLAFIILTVSLDPLNLNTKRFYTRETIRGIKISRLTEIPPPLHN